MHFFVEHGLEIGLVIFVVSFVSLAIWTFTRSRKEVSAWSSLPLGSGMDELNHNVKPE